MDKLLGNFARDLKESIAFFLEDRLNEIAFILALISLIVAVWNLIPLNPVFKVLSLVIPLDLPKARDLVLGYLTVVSVWFVMVAIIAFILSMWITRLKNQVDELIEENDTLQIALDKEKKKNKEEPMDS